jgi:hypothetical protein
LKRHSKLSRKIIAKGLHYQRNALTVQNTTQQTPQESSRSSEAVLVNLPQERTHDSTLNIAATISFCVKDDTCAYEPKLNETRTQREK